MPKKRRRIKRSPSEREGFAERIRELATFVGGPKALAERSGLSRAVIGKYLSGKSEPSRERLVKLAAAGGASLGWLVTGEGQMRAQADSFAYLAQCHSNMAFNERLDASRSRLVDHLAFKAEWLERVLRADPKRLALIEAEGDSMAPTIRGGDLLLLEAAEPPFREDGVYAFARPDGLAVKRLIRRLDGSFEIRSDNPVYGSEVAPAEALPIVGRVLWFGRRL